MGKINKLELTLMQQALEKRISQRQAALTQNNAPIHRARKLLALRELWEKRELHLFFISPYSPQLNIAEILWRKLKGK